jgi:serine/threonine protein kinase
MADAFPKTDSLDPVPGDEVDWTGQMVGEFRVMHRLGRGGMGQVYLAEQTSLKRKVALKLLNPDLASNKRSLLRFQKEAENVARATHANIVQIYTIGEANGINYIALEYIEGKNLREFIERKGTPELALGLHIITQVASALQRANELGIIHRDIKPENILLTKKGEVKVADFGLSRAFTEAGEPSITQSQVTMGTPLYMSPEQVECRAIDHRTDIYSFGVMCYYMFTGNPPFRGNSPIEVAYQHVHKEAQPLLEIRPDLPADLCAIIQKMMAKKPEDRYQTAREITREIHRIRDTLNLGSVAEISISSASLAGGAADLLNGSSSQPWSDPAPPRRWRTVLFSLCAILALASGWLVGWITLPRDEFRKDTIGKLTSEFGDPDFLHANAKPRIDEKELKQLVKKYANPESSRQMMTGLEHSVELGLYYIKEKRLSEADGFFQELATPNNKIPTYRHLGRLGHAIVLAFKDESGASNKEFAEFTAEMMKLEARFGKSKKDQGSFKDELDGFRYLWKDPPMRELVAKALNHNYANDPKNFPVELDVYRFPPKPTLKAAPQPVTPNN